jgi:SAM-dependent methyltransferase
MEQTTESVRNLGPDVSRICALIRQGEYAAALLILLVIPNRRTSRLLSLAESVPRRFQAIMHSLAEKAWKRQQAQQRDWLLRPVNQTTASEMLAFLYCHSLQDNELYHHFRCYFGQPRHLAGQTLAILLPTSASPILDLACGFGHNMHHWRCRHPQHQVVGIDRNFFHLYVAKNWVAPGAEYICSDADVRLPFLPSFFCGIFCSDAFHYFLRKQQCVDEMRRIVEPGGLIILSRFGNRQVEPHEGCELEPDGYLRLFEGLHAQLFSEKELLQRYLGGLRGNCESHDPNDLRSQKWISLVASPANKTLDGDVYVMNWPHGMGQLQLNPLYHKTHEDSSGCVTLELKFPTAWYRFENSECLEYMPSTVRLTRDNLEDMKAGAAPALADLIRQCVIIGLPERYL